MKILNSEIISVFTTMSTIWMYRVKTKYTQKPYQLEDGLRDSVKWYLEHSTEVNKKPYFKYINENLVED